MNTKERFVRCLSGQEVDRVPFIKLFGGENAIHTKWENEYPGIGKCIDKLLKVEGKGRGFEITKVNQMLSGLKPNKTIKENDKELVIERGDGGIEVIQKNGEFLVPHVKEYPVKKIDDWLKIKGKYLDPFDKKRFPSNWKQEVEMYKKRKYPLALSHGGVYGFARSMMGDENLSYAFFDDPDFVHDIMNTYTDMCLKLWEEMSKEVDYDLIECWEDMAYNGGSLISPEFFNRFMKPNYEKIASFAKAHNIKIILVDSDGYIEDLAGLMVDAGVTAMYPCEVQAGNSVERMRRRYPKLGCLGGLDKRVMSKTKNDIVREVEKAKDYIKKGRYIPGPDHIVLKGVTFENYKYFYDKLREVVFDTEFTNS